VVQFKKVRIRACLQACRFNARFENQLQPRGPQDKLAAAKAACPLEVVGFAEAMPSYESSFQTAPLTGGTDSLASLGPDLRRNRKT
jgi:hypothetical protein